jgi:4-amino-4-deoxy-L-arabinose transferase-like glycosyltransferase
MTPSLAQPATSRPRLPFDRLQRPCVLLGLLALWLLATLGWRPLLLPDEGRYAEVARSMLASGDIWVPRLDGLPFFHKPPLFYWIDLAAMKVIGSNVFAGRFASALGAWVMGATLLFAMRRWHGPRAAAIAVGVLATTPFFFVGGQYANHDMLVGALIGGAVLAIARSLEEPSRVDLRWLVAGWVLCALAMLAKGLIGVVLPAFVIGPWLLAQGRWRQMLKLLHPLGLLVFALVAAPWFVAMQMRYPGFFDYFFMEQHFRRFAQSNFNNVHGAWFFIVVLPALTLPWSVWLPAAWRRVVAGSDSTARVVEPPLAAEADADSRAAVSRGATLSAPPPATIALYVWWVIAVVGFFSIPSSKLVGYVLPALAPWCALLGLAVAARGRSNREEREATAEHSTLQASTQDPMSRSTFGSTSRRAEAWPLVMIGAAAVCVAIVGVTAWKAPQSNRALALALAVRIEPDDRVVMVDAYFYDVPFYARLSKPVIVASDWADPQLPLHDNWRKELFDAASFDPTLGRDVLRPLDSIDRVACGVGAVWFVVPTPEIARVAALAGAVHVTDGSRAELWRVPGRACP